jgi:hypothetical protein
MSDFVSNYVSLSIRALVSAPYQQKCDIEVGPSSIGFHTRLFSVEARMFDEGNTSWDVHFTCVGRTQGSKVR